MWNVECGLTNQAIIVWTPETESLLPSTFCKREELPLFGKWFDETHHPELVEGEGRGEIL